MSSTSRFQQAIHRRILNVGLLLSLIFCGAIWAALIYWLARLAGL